MTPTPPEEKKMGGEMARVEYGEGDSRPWKVRLPTGTLLHRWRQKEAVELCEAINAAHAARVKGLVDIVEELANTLTCHCQWNARLSDADFHRESCRIGRAKKALEVYRNGK